MQWLKRWTLRPESVPKQTARRNMFRPTLEALEDRQLLTLAAPTLIAPIDSAAPLTSFTWSPVDGASYYNFHLYNVSTNITTNGPNLTVTSLTLGAPLTVGSTYQWTVQAVDSVGNLGPWASTVTFGVTNLTAPTLIGPTGAAAPLPTFSWNPLVGADHYDIWLKNQNTGQVTRDANVPGVTWTPPSSLPQGSTYYWWVRGIDANGTGGPWSSAMSFTESVLPAPVLNAPTGSAVPQPTFSWNIVLGADHYDIWIQDMATNQVIRDVNVGGTTWVPSTPLIPQDKYDWWVRAIDPNGFAGTWSTTQAFTVFALPAPTLAAPTGTSATLPTFSWNAVTGADHYDIWVQDMRTGAVLRETNAAGVTWTPTGPLIQGDTYDWWVRAIDGSGRAGVWSSDLSFSVASLAAPKLTGPAGSSVTLPTFNWSGVLGADHYDIWVQDGTGNVLRNQNVAGTTWVPAGPLTAGAAYTWWVRAVDNVGSPGPWSAPLTFTAYALPAPTLVAPTGTSATLPNFSWNSVTGAAHYDIWVQDTRTGAVLRNIAVSGTTWTPGSPLLQGDTYEWWVRAIDSTGHVGLWSTDLSFSVKSLSAPTLVSPTGSYFLVWNQPFTWNAVTGADHYDIWMQDGKGNVIRNQAVAGTTWVPPSTLTAGAGYTWWVRAVDSVNSPGPWSSPLTFTAYALAAPMPIAPTGTSPSFATFSWNAVTGASFYEVWVDDMTKNQSAVLFGPNVSGTTWTPNTALIPGDKYRWWVRAMTSSNPLNGGSLAGAWSSEFDFTAVKPT